MQKKANNKKVIFSRDVQIRPFLSCVFILFFDHFMVVSFMLSRFCLIQLICVFAAVRKILLYTSVSLFLVFWFILAFCSVYSLIFPLRSLLLCYVFFLLVCGFFESYFSSLSFLAFPQPNLYHMSSLSIHTPASVFKLPKKFVIII